MVTGLRSPDSLEESRALLDPPIGIKGTSGTIIHYFLSSDDPPIRITDLGQLGESQPDLSSIKEAVPSDDYLLVLDRELLKIAYSTTGTYQLVWLTEAESAQIDTTLDLDSYIEIPTAPDRRHEPVVKDKGVPVWSIVAYVKNRGLSVIQVSEEWAGYITPDEVQAAVSYEEMYPDRVAWPPSQMEGENIW